MSSRSKPLGCTVLSPTQHSDTSRPYLASLGVRGLHACHDRADSCAIRTATPSALASRKPSTKQSPWTKRLRQQMRDDQGVAGSEYYAAWFRFANASSRFISAMVSVRRFMHLPL